MSLETDLENLIAFFHRLEQEWTNDQSRPTLIQTLKTQLQNLSAYDDPNAKKLSDLSPHLTESSTLDHISNYLVPIERLFYKHRRDDEFLVTSSDRKEKPSQVSSATLEILCHNWRSAFNVGSCLRTAETLGISRVWLTGYSPTPSEQQTRKTSMGTHEHISWSHHDHPLEIIEAAKLRGLRCFAVETSPQAQSVFEIKFPQNSLLIFGNERFGIDYEILKAADELISVPMVGLKNSLNVGVCVGIVSAFWRSQNS